MDLDLWAKRWGISPEALRDLRREFGTVNTDPSPNPGESEAAIQNRIRLEASRVGARLWRNNVGMTPAKLAVTCPHCGRTSEHTQRPVRYGLCNDSQKMNQYIKFPDLVGIRSVLITPQHVGRVIGQFLGREVKHGDWKWSGNDHEMAQLRGLELIASMGGDAAFAKGEGTL